MTHNKNPMLSPCGSLLIAVVIASAPGLTAQTALYSLPALQPFGMSSGVLVGDTNGNARADFVYASQATNQLRFIEGADGSPIGDVSFGSPIPVAAVWTAGDMDGDGLCDVVVNFRTSVAVYSGASHALLHQFQGPGGPLLSWATSAIGVGDLNLDGHDDLAIGIAGTLGPPSTPGHAEFYSGLDGSLMFSISDPGGNPGFGSVVLPAGDINGDGFIDLLTWTIGSPTTISHVWVISGLNTGVLHHWTSPPTAPSTWGIGATGGGDVDGDGVPDVAVSAPDPFGGPGFLYVYSGSTGIQILSATGSAYFPGPSHMLGDLNSDGLSEIMVGGQNEAFLVDGATGVVSSMTPTLINPTHFSAGGDVTGDGIRDVAVVHFLQNTISLYSPVTLTAAQQTPIGAGCGPQLSLTAPPVLGSTTAFVLTGAPASVLGVLVAGARVPAYSVWPGCQVSIDPLNPVLYSAITVDPAGAWTSALSIPRHTGLAGLTLAIQGVLFDPSG
ncbi:MAG TPA: VCBS repeat-containing protein, partial [Methylothermaceae bacterium]|nr:VCBS repeat-containing protein [Methylothermaceae bacterium]